MLSVRLGGIAKQLLPFPITPDDGLALGETMLPVRVRSAVPVASVERE
jgi:hypothetical protein